MFKFQVCQYFSISIIFEVIFGASVQHQDTTQIPGANTFIDDAAAKFAGPQQLVDYIEKLTKTSNCISLF